MPYFQAQYGGRLDPTSNRMFQSADQAALVRERMANMAYFNLGGLGKVVRDVGSIGLEAIGAASTVYGAYRGLTGGHSSTGESNVASAGGPTAHPVLKAAGTGTVPTTTMQKIEKIVDPEILGGPHVGGAVRHQRYMPPGTKGYHMIKRGPHAGLWVKNRHRNVCNIHALRRALSRAHGFERVARKVIHFTHPKKATGVAHFKARRRRR